MINKILFFLFLLLLPTQLGKHFFLPFSYLSGVRVDYLAPTVYLTDIIVFLLVIFNFKTVFKFFKNKKVLIGLFLLLINVLFSRLPIISFYWLIKITEFLVIFSLAKKMLKTLKEKSILTAFLLSGLLELFLSIAQFINKHSVQGIFYYFGERLISLSTPGVAKASLQGIEFLRPYGTFSHPNSLAGFFLVLYFFVLTYKKFNRYLVLKYLFLLVSSLLIFLSFSKIAILTYLFLSIIYHLKSSIKLKCRLCVLARLFMIMVVSFIFLQATTDPLTINKRIELMKNSITIILRYPIQGIGLGSYLIEQAKFSSKYYLFFNQPVHNIFLLFISETGLVLGGFILYQLINLLMQRRLTKYQWLLIFVIIITGFFDHYWLTLQQNFLLMG
ncbi:MAG: O-antigen ligase family protein, partial [Candidatus Roizmanbacteria bacterium]|nr:O-antigen ligase family protein [Candidatus Roizmanbacteria bacterium]